MIVSHRHRFIFVKSKKTAGTSIEIALSEHCGPDDIIGKISVEDELIRRDLGFREPQNLVVPIHRYTPRMAATLIRRRRRANYYNHMSAKVIKRAIGSRTWQTYFKFSIERNPYDKAISHYWFRTRNWDPRPSLAEFLRNRPVGLSNWPIYTIDSEIAVDRILRYENLEDDLVGVGEEFGIKIHLPETKAKGNYRRDQRPYTEVIDPASRAIIEHVCARELKAFGYTWD